MEKHSEAESNQQRKRSSLTRNVKVALVVVAAIVAILLSYVAYIYFASPAVVRSPRLEHYHFRMQIVVNGKAENFADKKYQTGYIKDQCNANLPEQPIHFHDNKDQFTHIHWEGMTGGMVLKYYGWNFIGGMNNALGYKLDDLSDIQEVTTHGSYLPDRPKDAKFYIYTGDENKYEEKNFDDFTSQDLEKFFGKTSNLPAHEINQKQASLLDKMFPTVSAHGGVEDGNDGEAGEETEQEKLTRINNLIGNVVLFVQKGKPTDQQIKDRFNNLEPLSDSTCGG
ncbi:MAG TPA: hypothetical protein VK497_01105 [Candidatus Saccharimonadales bacterium]|nr:hypothetical protein [Candidatus Saccharimonadales bacterium]